MQNLIVIDILLLVLAALTILPSTRYSTAKEMTCYISFTAVFFLTTFIIFASGFILTPSRISI